MKNETIDTTDTRDLVITREFDAPREVVFKSWSEAGQLKQWWGPKGFSPDLAKFEFKPGGTFHYSMQAGDGPKMWGKFEYREIEAPEKIIFINAFSDENGGTLRAPFSETWPKEMLNILTLTEKEGKTLMELRGRPINATEEEENTYHSRHEAMQQGFAGTFDQLDAFLESNKN